MLQEHSRHRAGDRRRSSLLLVRRIESADYGGDKIANFRCRWKASFDRRYAELTWEMVDEDVDDCHSWFCFDSSLREGGRCDS
jgi:hypothetical protein